MLCRRAGPLARALQNYRRCKQPVQAGGDPIYSAGVGAAYVFSINDVL